MWWKELLFTAFYAGYFPVGPGTAGTLVALAIYLLEYLAFGQYSWVVNLVMVALLVYPAIKLGDAGEEYFGVKDPQQVVLDEVLGYWISVLFWPFDWKIALAAFFIFRIVDMIKPPPIRSLQEKRGGLGIMIDDYLAGVYTNVIILAAVLLLRFLGWNVF
ncbi:MAG TPA: phosphatidylglycerophosphatase A [Spirochaetota bacterium]|nr:phosphatidylglycerophosphatase A [Spirochaetota bacterium]